MKKEEFITKVCELLSNIENKIILESNKEVNVDISYDIFNTLDNIYLDQSNKIRERIINNTLDGFIKALCDDDSDRIVAYVVWININKVKSDIVRVNDIIDVVWSVPTIK